MKRRHRFLFCSPKSNSRIFAQDLHSQKQIYCKTESAYSKTFTKISLRKVNTVKFNSLKISFISETVALRLGSAAYY